MTWESRNITYDDHVALFDNWQRSDLKQQRDQHRREVGWDRQHARNDSSIGFLEFDILSGRCLNQDTKESAGVGVSRPPEQDVRDPKKRLANITGGKMD